MIAVLVEGKIVHTGPLKSLVGDSGGVRKPLETALKPLYESG